MSTGPLSAMPASEKPPMSGAARTLPGFKLRRSRSITKQALQNSDASHQQAATTPNLNGRIFEPDTMYPTASTTPASRSFSPALAYRLVGVQTGVDAATPHQLIKMLFDGFVDAVAQARGALRDKQIVAKGVAICRAARIVEEGLKAGLNLEEGGQLAADLRDLYSYVTVRLTHANLRNDDAALAECVGLIQSLREAWVEIGTQAASTQFSARAHT